MEDAFGCSVGRRDDQGGDLLFFHQGESRRGEGIGADGEWVRVHDFAGGVVEGGSAVAFEEAAEVAVGDHTEELAGGTKDGGHAELLAGHLVDDLRHRGVRGDLGESVAGVHEFMDSGEALAEPASGVEFGEILGLPSTAAADLKGESVAEGEHHGSRCSGGEVVGAGFGGDAGIEDDVAGLGECGGEAAAECDELVSEALEEWEEAEEFFGLTAGGEDDDGVSVGQHSEVTVERIGGVEVVRGGSGGAEGRGDFAGDDAALTDAGDDDAIAGCGGLQEEIDCLDEARLHGAVEAAGELFKGCSFDAYECGRAR